MSKVIYFLSGLGADRRAFSKLSLPPDWDVRHVEWIPNKENEDLSAYSLRLAQKQMDTTKPFSLVGLSLGGIVSVELAKIFKPEKVILISSVATRREVPLLMRMLRYIPIHQWVPSSFYKRANPVVFWLFGSKTPDERRLVTEIMHDTSPSFARWALEQISRWKNETIPVKLFHIHGSADRIFPIYYLHPDVKIKGGGHFMVYARAEEVSEILRKQFENVRD